MVTEYKTQGLGWCRMVSDGDGDGDGDGMDGDGNGSHHLIIVIERHV